MVITRGQLEAGTLTCEVPNPFKHDALGLQRLQSMRMRNVKAKLHDFRQGERITSCIIRCFGCNAQAKQAMRKWYTDEALVLTKEFRR
eukprot:1153107-Pelagomonas_calceolata.AAC.2